MTGIIETKLNRTLRVNRAVGFALSVCFVLGALAVPAFADEWGDHRGWHGERHGWHDRDDGYYPAPPVVYGSPYYYPPPIVYGPGVGIRLPGVILDIH